VEKGSDALDRLPRRLGLLSAIGLVIGITIGSGIFRTPAVIATRVPDPTLMLLVWVIGGALALSGALALAELAAMFPRTGGLYVYLREGWGRLPAFLFGWAQLVLVRASALGGIATVFGAYALRSFGYDPVDYPLASNLIAAGAIVFAMAMNILGIQIGAAIVGLSTIAKYGALAVMVLLAFAIGGQHGATTANFTATAGPVDAGLFGLALISVLWAYDGFGDLSYVAGEVRDPKRTLPRALILGTVAIVVIYLAANFAYLYVQPVDRMAKSSLVAADTMQALIGQVGVGLIAVVVMISTFGSVNGSMLVNPRIFFAMAEDRLFFQTMARVHPRFKTPHIAILLTAGLGVFFVLTRTFEQLADTFVLTMWPFYALSVAAIYKLRRSRPDLERPYKVTGYPVVPALFILGAIYLIANALITEPLWTSVTFGIVLLGAPVYWLFFRRGDGGR
jgi:basic amino acid/polyamine antiporter, APA family